MPKTCESAAASFLDRYPSLRRALHGVKAKYIWRFYLSAPAAFGLQWLGHTCAPCSATDGQTPVSRASGGQYMPLTCVSSAPTYELRFNGESRHGRATQAKMVGYEADSFTVMVDGDHEHGGDDGESQGKFRAQVMPAVRSMVGPDARMSAVRVSSGGRVVFAPAVPLAARWTFDVMIHLPLQSSHHYQVLLSGPREQPVVADLSGHRLGMLDAQNRFVAVRGYSLARETAGWHRLTVVGANGVQTLFVDGARVGQSDAQAQSEWNGVGNWPRTTVGLNREWRGAVGTVRFYQYALSEEQVSLLE